MKFQDEVFLIGLSLKHYKSTENALLGKGEENLSLKYTTLSCMNIVNIVKL